MKPSEIAIEAAKIAIDPAGYLIRQIVDSTSKKLVDAEAGNIQDIAALRIDTERQELHMRMLEAQARVAQEVAIARRIETAEEVEMEEHYDYSREGKIGGKVDGSGASIGAGGAGRTVSRRIYKFRGNTSSTTSTPSAAKGGRGGSAAE